MLRIAALAAAAASTRGAVTSRLTVLTRAFSTGPITSYGPVLSISRRSLAAPKPFFQAIEFSRGYARGEKAVSRRYEDEDEELFEDEDGEFADSEDLDDFSDGDEDMDDKFNDCDEDSD